MNDTANYTTEQDTAMTANFQYFIENQALLFANYPNKWLLIHNEGVVHVSNSIYAVYTTGTESFGLGNFLLQYCGPDKSCYTQTFTRAYL